MPTTIKLRNSVTTTSAPSSLVQGEVAINITDKKVWVGNAATTPIQLLGDGGSASFTSIAFGAGTVSSPSITFTGDTNTGIYSPAADTIAFTEGGVESMRIDSSGNVGIGTSSPAARLDVRTSGSASNLYVISDISTSALASRIALGNSVGTVRMTIGLLGGGGETAYIGPEGSFPMYFQTNGTERMRIDSSGNVGIGTTTPSNFGNSNNRGITVNGQGTAGFVEMQSSGTAYGAVYANSSNAGIRSITALPLTFETNATERMRIGSDGNVAIGSTNTSGSGGKLIVTPTNTTGSSVYQALDCTNYVDSNFQINITGSASTDKRAVIGSTTNTALAFQTNLTERMRITSGGDLLIGKTTTANDTSGISLSIGAPNFVTSVSSSDGPYIQVVNLASSILNGYRFYSFRVGPSRNEVGSISTNGTSTTAYNTSSDYRLKENIAPMTGALNKVAQLKPVTYTWKSDGSNGQGFIAHELQAVVPDCVTGEKDAVDAEGNPKYQGVDTSFLVATLTAAIQEQQAMIQELKQEVALLKSK